jgi:hypothetical protein
VYFLRSEREGGRRNGANLVEFEEKDREKDVVDRSPQTSSPSAEVNEIGRVRMEKE